jgi:hypothetical protein
MQSIDKCARKYGKAGTTPRRLATVGFLAQCLRRKDEKNWINIPMDGE